MYDWYYNPNGESGVSADLDPRLPGARPTTLFAWLFAANPVRDLITI